ncbi:AraC family transcriptional regulator [Photobacterium sp. BZF1]|uniref:AraC family transcriptional regulator n=1 Tax=Photobacterium sp. BZF1 TaxID=1904457 RepID=UPI001653C6A0|nr:AraC family transcriptional regulator [Photobacterium sp. BZF1]MBC7006577.1 AraC family transcriptional regulator [Photobacterium sp. BZF1]
MHEEFDIDKSQRMISTLESLAVNQWFTDSIIPDVKFIRSNHSHHREPVKYTEGIVIILQGRKIAHLSGEKFTYDPYNYLALSVPIAFECETITSPGKPLLGISIKVTPAKVCDLLRKMNVSPPSDYEISRGMFSNPLPDCLLDAIYRLLVAANDPQDGLVLGPLIVDEIIYMVLCSSQGEKLKALAAKHGRFHQIINVLNRMHEHYDEKYDIAQLAKSIGMSSTAFHNVFKAVTATSPLRYLKIIRLQKAKTLMVQDGLSASLAATKVGYESPSQFSREFSRFFGRSPTSEVARIKSLNVKKMD